MASPRLRRPRNSGPTKALQFRPILSGSLWALIVSLAVFLVVALLLTYTGVPEKAVPTISLITSLLTVFFGGMKAAGRAGVNGWMHGSLTSLAYYVVLVAVGLLFYDKGFNLGMLARYIPLLLAGAFGGIVGVR